MSRFTVEEVDIRDAMAEIDRLNDIVDSQNRYIKVMEAARAQPLEAMDFRVRRVATAAKEQGRQEAFRDLRELGEIHCLAQNISEAELVRALAVAGMTISSVGEAQLIHLLPQSAA